MLDFAEESTRRFITTQASLAARSGQERGLTEMHDSTITKSEFFFATAKGRSRVGLRPFRSPSQRLRSTKTAPDIIALGWSLRASKEKSSLTVGLQDIAFSLFS